MTSNILSHLDDLLAVQHRDGVDIRATLLRILTDLYVARPDRTADEHVRYLTLARHLMIGIEPGARAAIVAKLEAYPTAPRDLTARLLAPAPAEVPVAAPTVLPAIPAAAAQDEAALAAVFFTAGSAERRAILAEFERSEAAPAPSAPAGAERAIRSLEAFALAGRPGEFIRELEAVLGLPREVAERMVNDPGGEPMVIAARALNMPLAVLQRILLFVNPAIGHSVRRVYDLTALYEEIGCASARRLVTAWAGASPRPRAASAHERRDDDSLRNAGRARPAASRTDLPAPQRLQRRS